MSNVDMPASPKPRAKAGANERIVAELLTKAGIHLRGKRRFKNGNVVISVDQCFQHGGTEYLLEVDSGNMAKLLVGQYVLLNELYTPRPKSTVFLVLHTYKNYNPDRTLQNLRLVNQQLYAGEGLYFGASHLSVIETCERDVRSVLEAFRNA